MLGKIGRELLITANGRQSLGRKLGLALIHMTATASALSLEATFGKERAQAQDLFRLASLARWGARTVHPRPRHLCKAVAMPSDNAVPPETR
jgi:hypothetical protein